MTNVDLRIPSQSGMTADEVTAIVHAILKATTVALHKLDLESIALAGINATTPILARLQSANAQQAAALAARAQQVHDLEAELTATKSALTSLRTKVRELRHRHQPDPTFTRYARCRRCVELGAEPHGWPCEVHETLGGDE